MDETTDAIYLTLQSIYNNTNSSTPQQSYINKSGLNSICKLGDYNLYLCSLNLTTSEIPYFNARNFISDFTTNKMIWSISLMSSNPTQHAFSLGTNTNLLVSGCGTNSGTNWQGVTVFLQYLSENANPVQYPNPDATGTSPSTAQYPDVYFNVHDINQVMDFINTAIFLGKTYCTIVDVANSLMYISFEPTTQLYTINVDDKLIQTNEIDFWTNGFLERILDAFRWQYYSDANISGNQNLNWKFIPTYTNKQYLDASSMWHFPAAYPCIENMITVQSVVITCGGSLQRVRAEYLPLPKTQADSAYLPSRNILKSFDIVFSGNLASANNTTLTFNVNTLDRPIYIPPNAESLTDLIFQFWWQDINNDLIPMQQPSISSNNIKFCLKKKK